MIYKSKIAWLILSGRVEHFYRPWIIKIDRKSNTFSVSKRNWYFFGFDSNTYKISQIKNIFIDNKMLYSNLRIRIYFMEINCIGLDNKEAQLIKNELLNIF